MTGSELDRFNKKIYDQCNATIGKIVGIVSIPIPEEEKKPIIDISIQDIKFKKAGVEDVEFEIIEPKQLPPPDDIS